MVHNSSCRRNDHLWKQTLTVCFLCYDKFSKKDTCDVENAKQSQVLRRVTKQHSIK